MAGPRHLYFEWVKRGKLRQDHYQLQTMDLLENLYHQLQGYSPPPIVPSTQRTHRLVTNAPKGLYLWGDVGTGKSLVMDIFYQSMNMERKRRIHFHNFMQDVHRRIHVHKKRNSQAMDPIPSIATELANEAWLLCFDELQVTDIADAMILRNLYSALMDRGVVMVTTSNRPPDELYKNGIQRSSFLPAIDLLKERLVVHSLNSGIDYRTKKTGRRKTYLFPNDDKAQDSMDAIWVALRNGEPASSKTISFLGRSFHIQEYSPASQVAKMSFQQVCASDHGAADYLELVKHVKTLILTDVIQMTTETKNEARRFITLLDALYENKVKLLMTSQVDVTHLFRIEGIPMDVKLTEQHDGAEEAFAFQRAVSRLREMQSEQWLDEPLSTLLPLE